MAQYIKMTNGCVSVLADVKDTATMNDKIEDGFYVETDDNDDIILIESDTLVQSDNSEISQILERVKTKQSKCNRTKGLAERDGK